MEELYPNIYMRQQSELHNHKDMNVYVTNLLLFIGVLIFLNFIFIKEPRRTMRRSPSSPILKV